MGTVDVGGSEAPEQTRRWRIPAALPALRGRWLTAYTILWLLVLPLAIAIPVAGLVLELNRASFSYWAPLGILPKSDGPEILVRGVIGEEARRAGIRTGDAIVLVDGRAVPGRAVTGSPALARIREMLDHPEGTVFEVVTRSPDGTLRTSRLERRMAHAEERYAGTILTSRRVFVTTVVSNFLPLLGYVPVAVLLFFRRRDPVAALLSMSLLLVCAASNIAGATWGALALFEPGRFISVVGWCGVTIVLLVFPSGRFEPRWTFWVLPPLLIWGPLSLMPAAGPFRNIVITGFIAVGVAALALRYRRLAAGAERQQLSWTLFGFAAGTALLAIASAIEKLIVPTLGDHYVAIAWANLSTQLLAAFAQILFVVGLLVSLLRYRLYDADAVISRSVTYGALTVMMLAIFAGTEKVIELLGEAYLGESLGILAGGLGAAVAAMMMVPLHHRIEHWAKKRFQKQLIRLRYGLPLLVGDLRETAGLERIAAAVLDGVTQGVRARHAALLIGDSLQAARGIDAEAVASWQAGWVPAAHDRLDCDRRDPLFPMRVPLEAEGHGRVGWLLLGPRPDGSLYGKDEREALAEIADPVARAVEIVRTREAREERQEGRFAAIEAKLASVLRGLSRRKPRTAEAAE